MKRRNFIQYSAASLLLSGCEVRYSPYAVDTDEPKRDADDIKRMPPKSADSSSYSIALLSDTHRYYSEFKKVIQKIEQDSTNYNFAIHGGDITDAGLQAEFDFYHKMRSQTALPFVHCIGNHDSLTNGIEVYRNSYGNYDRRFRVGALHIIIFNNNTWEFGDKPVNLDWLEREVKAAKNIINTEGGHILVVNHIHHDSDERFSEEEIHRYRQMMIDNEVSLSINGHNHTHGVQVINGMKYLTIGSVGNLSFTKLTFTGPNPKEFTLDVIDV